MDNACHFFLRFEGGKRNRMVVTMNGQAWPGVWSPSWRVSWCWAVSEQLSKGPWVIKMDGKNKLGVVLKKWLYFWITRWKLFNYWGCVRHHSDLTASEPSFLSFFPFKKLFTVLLRYNWCRIHCINLRCRIWQVWASVCAVKPSLQSWQWPVHCQLEFLLVVCDPCCPSPQTPWQPRIVLLSLTID